MQALQQSRVPNNVVFEQSDVGLAEICHLDAVMQLLALGYTSLRRLLSIAPLFGQLLQPDRKSVV